MSPSEQMIRTIHWVCACCGEVDRAPHKPSGCTTCGRPAGSIEQREDAAIPAD